MDVSCRNLPVPNSCESCLPGYRLELGLELCACVRCPTTSLEYQLEVVHALRIIQRPRFHSHVLDRS